MNPLDLTRDEYGDFITRIVLPLYAQETTVNLFPDLDGDGGVSDKMVAAVQDAERLGVEHHSALEAMLYAHAEQCFESTSYGHIDVPEAENVAEANRQAFGVRTSAEAFSAAGTPEVQVSGNHDSYAHRYAVLVFYPPWEDEHGCGIVLRNGLPVGWGSADVYVGGFEEKTP